MKIQMDFNDDQDAMECVLELRRAVLATGWPSLTVILTLLLIELGISDEWPDSMMESKLIEVFETTAYDLLNEAEEKDES